MLFTFIPIPFILPSIRPSKHSISMLFIILILPFIFPPIRPLIKIITPFPCISRFSDKTIYCTLKLVRPLANLKIIKFMIYDVDFKNYYCNGCKIAWITILMIFWIFFNIGFIVAYSKNVY